MKKITILLSLLSCPAMAQDGITINNIRVESDTARHGLTGPQPLSGDPNARSKITTSPAPTFGNCWPCMHGCTREENIRLCGKEPWAK